MSRTTDSIISNEERGVFLPEQDEYDKDQERLSQDEGYLEFLARLEKDSQESVV